MTIQAVRLLDAENLFNAVVDAISLRPPIAVGVHARVVGARMGEIVVDYAEVVRPGDVVMVMDRKDW